MYQMILPTHGMAASMLLFGALPQLALAGWSLDTLTEQSCFPDGVCTAKDVVVRALSTVMGVQCRVHASALFIFLVLLT